MNILKTIVLGIVEGISEWMPISSTAHLKIFKYILAFDVSPEFFNVFEVVIQLGAAMALFLLFFKKIWPFGASKRPLGKGILSNVKKDKIILWLKITTACIPVILYELFIEDRVTFINDDNEMSYIALALMVVGILFLLVEYVIKKEVPIIKSTREITFLNAGIIGITQLAAAIIPGVSRSGATIIAALLMKISRVAAIEFTYELAIPVMFGASLMKIIKYSFAFSLIEIVMLIIGMLVTFVVSLFIVKFILGYLKKHNFVIFGIYRILLGILIFIFLV